MRRPNLADDSDIRQPDTSAPGGLSFEIYRVSDVTVLPPSSMIRLVWSEEGGRVACGGRHWRVLSPRRYLLVPVDTEAALRGADKSDGRFLALGADRSLVESIEAELRSVSRGRSTGSPSCQSIARMRGISQTRQPDWMLNALRDLVARLVSESPDLDFLNRHGRLLWERLVYSLALARTAGPRSRPESPRKRMLSVRLRRARRVIERDFSDPLSVSDLAAVACISRFHFVREFRRAYGQTPYQMLLSTRLGHAYRLLAAGQLTVQEVTRRAGFSSADGFYRAFRKRYRQCPSAFQTRHTEGQPLE